MATYKRIDGDYHIVSVNASDSIYLDTENAEISGNLIVAGNVVVEELNLNNVNATYNVTAGGNVAATYVLGNGRFLTDVISNVGGASILQNGTTNVNIPIANGAVTVSFDTLPNLYQFTNTAFSAVAVESPRITTNQITSGDSTQVVVDDGLVVGGAVDVSGNVTANFFQGNGSQLTGIDATSISNGTSNMRVVSASGNIAGNIAGNTILTLSSTGLLVTGSIQATNGFVGLDATKISNGTSQVQVLASGGNIEANVAGATVAVISSSGIAITGNLSVTGNASLSGNILGDRVQNGTTSFDIQTPDGNANISVGGVANVAVFTTTGANIAGTLNATGNITGGNLLTSGNIVDTGALSIITAASGNVNLAPNGTNRLVVTTTGANIAGTLNATGNITGGNLLTSGNIVDTGALSIITAASGNINLAPNGTNTLVVTTTGANVTGNLSVSTGNITGGNLILSGAIEDSAQLDIRTTASNGNIVLTPNGTGVILVAKDIVNGQANGVGNIGSSSGYFNTIFATATSAQYADLAELYLADNDYNPGTVLEFGGVQEVTLCNTPNSHKVAGVVSTNPAYVMNSGLAGDHVCKLALVGRVQCFVRGPVEAGDLLVSDTNGWARVNNDAAAGRIIGKSLQSSLNDGEIEIVVGKH